MPEALPVAGNARSAASGGRSEGISRTTPKRCQWQKKRGVVEEAAGELRAKASKATNAATMAGARVRILPMFLLFLRISHKL